MKRRKRYKKLDLMRVAGSIIIQATLSEEPSLSMLSTQVLATRQVWTLRYVGACSSVALNVVRFVLPALFYVAVAHKWEAFAPSVPAGASTRLGIVCDHRRW